MKQGEFWSAERILKEKEMKGVSHYLVQWVGADENGIPWNPSWVNIFKMCYHLLISNSHLSTCCAFQFF